jgi:hypothetical protein
MPGGAVPQPCFPWYPQLLHGEPAEPPETDIGPPQRQSPIFGGLATVNQFSLRVDPRW